MKPYYILTVLLFLAAVATFLYFYFFKKKNVARTIVISPQDQENYYKQKTQKEELFLNIEEQIKVSWYFFVKIVKTVRNSFSREDKIRINELGTNLAQNGMIYQHDMSSEIRNVDKEAVRNFSAEKNKGARR